MQKKLGYKFDWYPYQWHAEHLSISLELGGFLTFIKTLIAIDNKPLVYDFESIGGRTGLTKKKAEKLTIILLEKELLFLTEDNKISHVRAIEEVENYQERIKKYEENGRKNAQKRWGTQQNQQDKNSTPIFDDMLNSNSKINSNNKSKIENSENDPIRHREKFNPQTIRAIERIFPGHEADELIKKFWESIASGETSMNGMPDAVFITWCGKHIKPHPPTGLQ